MPLKGKISFEALEGEEALNHFFKHAFPDAFAAMPDLFGEFFSNPTGNLSTVQCSPWYYENQCLLIGDAAHGIVPFFGQGMNCAFEDCRMLAECLRRFDDDWEKVLPAFYESRKPNTDAVAAMSMDNYHEIQQGILDEKFNLKKQLQQELMQRYPKRYISKHVLVMFTNTPYKTCWSIGEIQERFLDKLCSKVNTLQEMDWQDVDKEMRAYEQETGDFAISS